MILLTLIIACNGMPRLGQRTWQPDANRPQPGWIKRTWQPNADRPQPSWVKRARDPWADFQEALNENGI